MALPSNLTYGTVVGTFLRAVADSPLDDDQNPEGIPVDDLQVTFSVGFTPKLVRDGSATPPTMIVIDDIKATINSTGTLVGPDFRPGVKLVASSNPNLAPTGWTWTVTLRSATFPTLSFSFTLDADTTVDLATVLQVPASPGATLDAWLAAVGAANAARDAAIAAAASVPSRTELAATYAPRRKAYDGTDAVINLSLIDLEHDATQGYLYHLHTGAGMTGGFLLGLGVGDGGPTAGGAILVSQKAASTGTAIALLNQAGTTGSMLTGTHLAANSPAFLSLDTANTSGTIAPLVQLTANGNPGTRQSLLSIQSGVISSRGGFGSHILEVYGDSGIVDVQGTQLRINGAILNIQEVSQSFSADVTQRRMIAANNDTTDSFYRYAGSAGYWYGSRFATNADGNPAELAIQTATTVTTIGSHAWKSAIRFRSNNANSLMAFFGATPIAQPSSTPAAATDAASTQTLVNALRTALLNLGLIA